MLRILIPVLVVVVALASGCPAAFDCGGLAKEPPTEVSTGKGFATRSDNVTLNGTATWASGTFGAVDVGGLDMPIAHDVTGTALDSLVSDGAFPICVALSEAGSSSSVAQLFGTPTFKTDASHTGNVALDKLDGEQLLGRFAVNLVSTDGSTTVEVTNGVFSATRHQ
jgi:hypothetical protein